MKGPDTKSVGHWLLCGLCLLLFSCQSFDARAPELSLWSPGTPKAEIETFVDSVTDPESPHFLPQEERIAVFDMDGTILLEKPMYLLFGFALDRVLAQVEAQPELAEQQPYRALLEKDTDYFHENMYGPDGLYDVLLYAFEGMSDEAYAEALARYLEQPHPRFGRAPDRLMYRPVLQLIDYLEAYGFAVYICTGSDASMVRFGIDELDLPPERIIGTDILTEWNGEAFIRVHEFVQPLNDREGKPVNIRRRIGRVPVLVVGNSRGDLEMLNYSKQADHSLQLIVNHDDPEREYAYSADKMKELCAENGWIEISMKNDFVEIF